MERRMTVRKKGLIAGWEAKVEMKRWLIAMFGQISSICDRRYMVGNKARCGHDTETQNSIVDTSRTQALNGTMCSCTICSAQQLL
nr:hypothetical protein [Tanacetum cinerariifolium]